MSSTSSAMSTTTTTTTTTTFNQEVVDYGSNTASRGECFDVELNVDKCKFYPLKPLAVIAGNVVSVTSTVAIDDSESTAHHHPQQQLKIGDRCLVNVAPSTGQVLSLMKRWANECRENKKCTNWITIAEHMVTCRIDIDTTMLELEKSRSVCDAYILRCSRPGAIVRICDPSTLYVTILMDQSKFYPSKLAILDGVILKINEDNTATSQSSSSSSTTISSTIRNSNKDLSCLLEKGERCWLHVRSNVVSLLKTLHGESMTGIDDDNENENENTGDNNGNINSTNIVKSKKKKSKIATGWVQFTRSIPVTCRIVIDDNLLKRKCNLKGAFTLECYEIIDIQKSEINSNIIPTRKNHNDLKTKDECDIIPQNRDIVHHPPKRLDRKERHRVFAEFLVNTYGADFLSTGSGVLDVAGGGGALSHALFNLGIKSCVLDPDPRCDVETVPFQVIDEPLSGDGLQLTGVVADNDKNGDDDLNNYLSDDHITAKRRSRIRKLVRSCSVIVGMHPDEATEAVIDTSLRLGKPFAILPCCVFRNLNAERLEIRKQKLGGGSGGDPFRSYNTFCQYLLDNKAPAGIRFETENLPFEGRNKVIYLQSYSYTCQVINP